MKPNDDDRDWLNRLMKELEKLRKDIAKYGWAVENIATSVEERAEEVADAKRKKTRKRVRTSRPRAGTARQSNVRYVKEGVSNVVIEHDADGSMLAHIENIGLPVQLKTSRRLRELLLALCGKVSCVNSPEQGVVPFKSSSELIEAIKEISGVAISRGNLQNLVQHLRDLFTEARINPDLVETGGGGYRLRLRMDGGIHERER